MTVRLHLLVLTVAAVGVWSSPVTPEQPPLLRGAVTAIATIAVLFTVMALVVIPRMLLTSLLCHGVLFAMCTVLVCSTGSDPSQTLCMLSLACLGLMGFVLASKPLITSRGVAKLPRRSPVVGVPATRDGEEAPTKAFAQRYRSLAGSVRPHPSWFTGRRPLNRYTEKNS